MFQRSSLCVVGALCLICGAMTAGAEDSAPSAVAAAKGLSKAFQHVAEVASPSIVSLEVRVKPGLGWTWWQGGSAVNDPLANANRDRTPDWVRRSVPQMDAARPSHVGSGFLIDNKGTILTAFHVVEHAEEIHVRTHEGHEFLATAILTDPQSDVAVLRIPAADDLKPLRFGNSDKLGLGEWVVAVGNPYNTGIILTPGIISTKGKGPSVLEHADFLETTAVINLGNSGGPLLNLDGEVVGINTLFQHPSRVYDGIHFAVPSNTAKWVASELLDHGKVHRSFLGVHMQELDFKYARQHKVAPWSGVLISAVNANSPADDAGIHEGDILIEYDGHRVLTAHGLQRHVERTAVGKTVEVIILRHGQRQQLSVKVREHVIPTETVIPITAPPADRKS